MQKKNPSWTPRPALPNPGHVCLSLNHSSESTKPPVICIIKMSSRTDYLLDFLRISEPDKEIYLIGFVHCTQECFTLKLAIRFRMVERDRAVSAGNP